MIHDILRTVILNVSDFGCMQYLQYSDVGIIG